MNLSRMVPFLVVSISLMVVSYEIVEKIQYQAQLKYAPRRRDTISTGSIHHKLRYQAGQHGVWVTGSMPAVTQGKISGHVVFTDNPFFLFGTECSSESFSVRGVPCPEERRLDRLTYQCTFGKRYWFVKQTSPEPQLHPDGSLAKK